MYYRCRLKFEFFLLSKYYANEEKDIYIKNHKTIIFHFVIKWIGLEIGEMIK